MVSGPRLEAPAGLLARWGIPADAELTRAERGCNNQTFTVAPTTAGRARHAVPAGFPEPAARAWPPIPALERFGRAIGLLSRALRPVAWSDAPQDWRGDPLRAHPDAPRAGELARALRARGRAHGPDPAVRGGCRTGPRSGASDSG